MTGVLSEIVNWLAILTFGALLWQLVRAEGEQPPESVEVDIDWLDASKVIDSHLPVWVVDLSVTAETAGVLYDVSSKPIGDATAMHPDAGFASCLMHGDHPVVSRFAAPIGRTMRILVQWHCLSPVLKLPVAQAVLLEIESPLPGRPDGSARHIDKYVWHWFWFAWLRRLLNGILGMTAIEFRFRLGEFRKPKEWWKSTLPDGSWLR
ncbi:hypothetical protein [Bifidobacterium sp. SO1]|uniref:hypothetical protein n=1 Tax=Bifidobacterium sp. SO1 TaxID=2809029 RepID=UPI001BDC3FB7|nr:hypothetical protein [Bifidobacterium sp. SO1]MBT1161281.1 hypothetical protein [Bifidobacterium sp. SO1]